MTKRKKLIIFDWDGTVMDSVPKIVNTMNSAAQSLKLTPPSDAQTKNIIGMSLEKAMTVLFPEHDSLHAQLVAAYKEHYLTVDTTPTPLFPHVKSTLKNLLEKNYLLAVATGKSRVGLDRLLAQSGLGEYFVATRTSCEAQSKPHPDMLRQLVSEINIPVSQALMIGDTKIDMQMAKSANMDAIGVTFGVHDKQALMQHTPLATVDCFSQLLYQV